MDIKLKNSKNRYLVIVLAFVISLFGSIAVMSTYSSIKKEAESRMSEYNPYEDYYFLENIFTSNYVLYRDILEAKTGAIKLPSERFLSQNTIDYLVDKKIREDGYYDNDPNEDMKLKEEYSTNIKDEFNSSFNSWQSSLFSLKNLEYFAIDKESKTSTSNTTEELSLLYRKYANEIEKNNINSENDSTEDKSSIEEAVTKEEMEVLKKNYSFYAIIDYDNEGNINIVDSFGIEKNKLEKTLISKKQSENMSKVDSIKNMTLVYAVPSELKYEDQIYWNVMDKSNYGYYDLSYAFVGIASIVVIFILLLVPYKISKDLPGFESIVKIPFEINIIALALMITFLYQGSVELISMSTNGEFINALVFMGLDINNAGVVVNIINILYWLIYFVTIFISVAFIKHIFNVGIRKYFTRKTITGKVLSKTKHSIIKSIKYIKETDFREKSNKVILIVTLVNLVVLCIISSLWFFGIILAVIYSVVLFVLIKKYYIQILDNYNKLLKYTNEIEQGNLNVNMEEQLGIFEPMKEKISNIQTGFKKAVDEEVKSQSMKTELISNVSHDLKTPLTSIITYVDLLKDESIDDEKRKQYLNTLDKKSQRLKVLIEDLFEVSKASSGNINLNIVDVDIVSLMKQTLLELRDQTSQSSLVFKNKFPEYKVMLPLDSQRTFRIFENLIVNISKYSMKNSRVYIDIIDNENSVDVVLKNMSAVEIDFNVNDIVERFVRGDKSRNTDGSGLGLAIAKSFVELQKGKFNIDVDGDLFKVTITFYKN